MIIVIAIIAALAFFVIGVIAEETTTPMRLKQAEAKGCNNGTAFNASGGRCFHG